MYEGEETFHPTHIMTIGGVFIYGVLAKIAIGGYGVRTTIKFGLLSTSIALILLVASDAMSDQLFFLVALLFLCGGCISQPAEHALMCSAVHKADVGTFHGCVVSIEVLAGLIGNFGVQLLLESFPSVLFLLIGLVHFIGLILGFRFVNRFAELKRESFRASLRARQAILPTIIE